MRPVKLEMSGFASFRQPTEVDFSDANLFALSGPTGSGKSSVVDAIAFSLYGSVPRYDDERLVGPVVSSGMNRMAVSFSFSSGTETYRATRLVKLSSKGRATTPEARLERLDDGGNTVETVAGDSNELTEKVVGLLGLTFSEFCRVVVLPQGDFQQFMHATPKERRNLLFRLLRLEFLDELGAVAREHEQSDRATVESLEERLSELAFATGERVTQAEVRIGELDRLFGRVVGSQSLLEQARQKGGELRSESDRLGSLSQALSEMQSVPSHVRSLLDRVSDADSAVVAAQAAVDVAHHDADVQSAVVDDLPDVGLLDRTVDIADRLNGLERSERDALDAAEMVGNATEAASLTLERCRETFNAAERTFELLRREHLAYTLAADVKSGDPCPVCAQDVPDGFVVDVPDGMERASAKVEAERSSYEQAMSEHASKERAQAVADTKLESASESVRAERERFVQCVESLPDGVDGHDLDDVRATADSVREQHSRLRELQQALKGANVKLREVRDARSRLDAETQRAWDHLNGLRDKVSSLSPPSASQSGTLVDAWAALSSWASQESTDVAARKRDVDADMAAVAREMSDQADTMVEEVRSAGLVDATVQNVRDVVVAAQTSAGEEMERLLQAMSDAQDTRERLDEAQSAHAASYELSRLLDTRNFATWVGNKVLLTLADAASTILHELTGGAYSLVVNERGAFHVVDHAAGDEVRSAKTLSGGETFVTALSLALALAEQVTSQAAGSTSRLETLILDEGFGTLDPSMRDMVATAIEELGQSGRTVGIITHFADLSERIPTQFVVAKGPSGSTVTRVAA